MNDQETLPAETAPSRWTRDYLKCGWIFVGIAAFFSIAPAKGIALIVFGLMLGAIFSFLAYGASRFRKNRLAVVLFLIGLIAATFFFMRGPTMMENMMDKSRRQEEKRLRETGAR